MSEPNISLEQYHKEICTLLGQDPTEERFQWRTAAHYRQGWRDPEWTAACIYRDIVGPDGLEEAKAFARKLGFNE